MPRRKIAAKYYSIAAVAYYLTILDWMDHNLINKYYLNFIYYVG